MRKRSQTSPARVSLKELAARLNTSVCTVSKALRNQPKVSEAMRAKVLALADELGYEPNLAASSMARRHFRVAWIYPEAWPSYHLPLLRGGIHRAEVLRDFNLSVTPRDFHNFSDVNDCINAVKKAQDDGFDAMVVCPGTFATADQNKLSDFLSGLDCQVIQLGGNEIPPQSRICNVRQHSLLTGQMAGNLAAMLLPEGGSAGIIIGSMALDDHCNKVKGFSEMLNSKQSCRFAGYVEAFDVPEKAAGAVSNLLKKSPELAVLYVATENIHGVLSHLESCNLLGRIKIIGTGTSDDVNNGLRNGCIQFAIDEKPFLLGETAIDAVCRKIFLNSEVHKTFLIPSEIRIACQLDRDCSSDIISESSSRIFDEDQKNAANGFYFSASITLAILDMAKTFSLLNRQ